MNSCEYRQVSCPGAPGTPRQASRHTRKWEVFPGRNRFCCDGRVMMARQGGVFLLTLTLILTTSTLFFIFDCPYLSEELSPVVASGASVLFVVTVLSLLRTALSDPGVIPRSLAGQGEEAGDPPPVSGVAPPRALGPPPRVRQVVINGQMVSLKFCFTCKIFRPPRASHCSVCDNCVERFDHHCPWVGNCVGVRNYRAFFLFLTSLAMLTLYMLAFSLAHLALRSRHDGFLSALKESPASVVVALVCFLSVWSVVALAGFHSYLVLCNQTTNEDMKKSWSNRKGRDNFNPYSRGGPLQNCCYVLCAPLQPSLIDLRGFVNVESQDSSNGNPAARLPLQPNSAPPPPPPPPPPQPLLNTLSTADEEYTHRRCDGDDDVDEQVEEVGAMTVTILPHSGSFLPAGRKGGVKMSAV